MTVTLKFQSSGMVPGSGQPVTMRGGSLTVGRGPANDLVLPDPDRMLSKNHFVLEEHNGRYVIVDLSTNGTFLNYSKVPLGRTPKPLNSGDVLSAGGYELVVEIGAELPDLMDIPAPTASAFPGNADTSSDPLAVLDDPSIEGDFLDDLLGAEGGPKGPTQIDTSDPIDELLLPMGDEEDPFFKHPEDGTEGSGASLEMHSPSTNDSFKPGAAFDTSLIPDDWDNLLEPDNPAPTKTPETVVPKPEVAQAPVPPASAPVAQPAPAPVAAAPQSGGGDQTAAKRFIEALDCEDLAVADADLDQTMARLGRVMRTMIIGLREILMTRTSIKSEFRIDQTMISAGGNNPLKFSLSEDHAIEALVKPKSKGYLSPESATEEALDDIKAHEVAMVTGMQAAIKGVLSKLDPQELAGQIETSGAFGSMFKGKKARYWEVYEKMYSQISDQAENDFHELFSREFARAYKEQLDKLK
ncbi:type VI secretion system-associated FHA domain protein TagH [Sulfitobacter mediterraneus]|uniref:type VI secretion system-associated FHA domain protein TagH n=1 Tax=Sulfitobacter mediterraneus TaxID=83219 RepID=UPI0019349CF0|nr:type VI secretion system-associated FHA domain protein TagH [Sulfitobacter mediterraneus]MBM1633955.1 type VI secretion system-associated FHA domain protein TagH [Sulfitobacter mediterraneus]MBM1641530.1 type VI secretion system-associated FHA domain protein TagH [Sulfitobacter mediterraneus]MBM1645819.1 type VI secretion system-associated FHA domain protein TagH [Sulfitobacter mediterraneus]MBM1649649.1 type VI secretion system-associated FHA domain protein TagH [Sulfitobacter mediterraneus